MRPRPKGLSIRYYISALLIIISAGGLALAWDIYQESAEIDLQQQPSKAPEPEAGVDMGQMEALFQEQPVDPGRYQVIADKNLFSENRRAAAEQAAQQAKQNAPERREEVRLLGTSIMGKRKSAMMRFLRFSDKKKAHIVELGQTVSDEGEGAPSYTLVDVEQRRVTLKDQGGQTFSVSMDETEQELAQGPGQDQQGEARPEAWQRMQEIFQGQRGTPDPAVRTDQPGAEPEKPSKPAPRQGTKAPPSPTTSADNTASGTWNLIR